MNIMDPSQNQAGEMAGHFFFVTNGSVKRMGDGMGYWEISLWPMLDVNVFFFCKKQRSNFGGNQKPEFYAKHHVRHF